MGPEYYGETLTIPSKSMEVLINRIIVDRTDSINRKLLAGGFENDDEFVKYITGFLEMFALGIMGVRESDLALVYSKPVGPGPSREMEDKLDKK